MAVDLIVQVRGTNDAFASPQCLRPVQNPTKGPLKVAKLGNDCNHGTAWHGTVIKDTGRLQGCARPCPVPAWIFAWGDFSKASACFST